MATNTDKLIQFVLDPAFDFGKWVAEPAVRSAQQFFVRGYQGPGFNIKQPQGRAANCVMAVNEAIDLAVNSLGREFNWVKVPVLNVNPEAGILWNAYYDRRGLKFFSNFDQINQRSVYTSAAAKIVFHETGHAILDAIRPDLWNYTNFEVWAFHEAFGDLWALLCTLRNDELLYPRDERFVTSIGWEFGQGVYKKPTTIYSPLRDLTEQFDYSPPTSLAATGPREMLTAEPHSFSRVFSGAIYRVLMGIHEAIQNKDNLSPKEALREAANVVSKYLITAASLAAVNENFFDSVAKALIFVDIQNGEPYRAVIRDVLYGCGILTVPIAAASVDPINPTQVEVAPKARMLIEKKEEHLALGEEVELDVNNPLHQIAVRVGRDNLQFDVDGDGAFDVEFSANQSNRLAALDDVSLCLDYLHRNNKVDQPNSSFGTWKGTLLRRHFACCFHT